MSNLKEVFFDAGQFTTGSIKSGFPVPFRLMKKNFSFGEKASMQEKIDHFRKWATEEVINFQFWYEKSSRKRILALGIGRK